jgi:anti-anti-sigma factor
MATLQTGRDGAVTVVTLTGSLNQQGVDSVEPPFNEATGLSDRMVVDLSRVDVVNTPAIAMFLGAHRAAHRTGGRVIFTGVQGMVEDTLRRCRLDTVLTIVPDLREAVEWAKQ